jgi:hypothetical protein
MELEHQVADIEPGLFGVCKEGLKQVSGGQKDRCPGTGRCHRRLRRGFWNRYRSGLSAEIAGKKQDAQTESHSDAFHR